MQKPPAQLPPAIRASRLMWGSDFPPVAGREGYRNALRWTMEHIPFRSESAFGYQNIMYLAAGQIIPAVTGKSWDDFVRERIFMPLGMTASHTSVPTQPSADDVATPHAWIDRRMWNTSHLVFKRGPEVSEVTIETR